METERFADQETQLFQCAHIPEFFGIRSGISEWRGNTELSAYDISQLVPDSFRERYRQPNFRVFVSSGERAIITFSQGLLTLERVRSRDALDRELYVRFRIDQLDDMSLDLFDLPRDDPIG